MKLEETYGEYLGNKIKTNMADLHESLGTRQLMHHVAVRGDAIMREGAKRYVRHAPRSCDEMIENLTKNVNNAGAALTGIQNDFVRECMTDLLEAFGREQLIRGLQNARIEVSLEDIKNNLEITVDKMAIRELVALRDLLAGPHVEKDVLAVVKKISDQDARTRLTQVGEEYGWPALGVALKEELPQIVAKRLESTISDFAHLMRPAVGFKALKNYSENLSKQAERERE